MHGVLRDSCKGLVLIGIAYNTFYIHIAKGVLPPDTLTIRYSYLIRLAWNRTIERVIDGPISIHCF